MTIEVYQVGDFTLSLYPNISRKEALFDGKFQRECFIFGMKICNLLRILGMQRDTLYATEAVCLGGFYITLYPSLPSLVSSTARRVVRAAESAIAFPKNAPRKCVDAISSAAKSVAAVGLALLPFSSNPRALPCAMYATQVVVLCEFGRAVHDLWNTQSLLKKAEEIKAPCNIMQALESAAYVNRLKMAKTICFALGSFPLFMPRCKFLAAAFSLTGTALALSARCHKAKRMFRLEGLSS